MSVAVNFNVKKSDKDLVEYLKVKYEKGVFGGHFVAHDKESAKSSTNKQSKFFDPILTEAYIACIDNKIYKYQKQLNFMKDYCRERGIDIEDNTFVEFLCRKLHNLHTRRQLFIDKFNMQIQLHKHDYVFFITQTYDNKKHTEESFRKALKKAFGNFHTRRGWKVMGVFERAPETNRLHFHGILFCKKKEMVGKITEVEEYNPLTGKKEKHHSNSFFEKKFGRNDFAPITWKCADDVKLYHNGQKNQQVIDYILKYVVKSGEKIFYTRGIESHFEVPKEDVFFAAEFFDFIQKYVLFEDIMDTSCERIILRC